MRVIAAGLLGGVIMFVWSFISHAILPFHGEALNTLPGEQMALDAQFAALQAGIYHYPGLPEDGSWEQALERMRAGPAITFMVVHPSGREPFPMRNFVIGFASQCVAAFVAALLLACAVDRLRGYRQRVLFVVGVGVFAIFGHYIQAATWWGYTTEFFVLDVIDMIVAPLLSGLAIAALVTPRRAADAPPEPALSAI